MKYERIKCFRVLILFAVVIMAEISVCSASRTPLYNNLYLDEVVNNYNKIIVDFYDNTVGIKGLSDIYVLKNKKKVGGDDKGGLYSYGLGGRKNQLVRFLTNEREEILAIEVVLHMQSPIMKNLATTRNSCYAGDLISHLLIASFAVGGVSDEDLEKIIDGLYHFGYLTKEEVKMEFICNNKKYWVEKNYNDSIGAVMIEIFVE